VQRCATPDPRECRAVLQKECGRRRTLDWSRRKWSHRVRR
jgi:hypothetical protein